MYKPITDEQLNKFLELYPVIKRDAIKNIYIKDFTGEIRFVNRDGVRILQQECIVKAEYSYGVSHGGYEAYWDDSRPLWIDVPLVENE